MVTKRHHAEAKIVTHRGVTNAIHHALQRFPRAFNVRPHADGGIHNENHRTAIIAQRIRISGRCGCGLGGG